MIFPYDYKQIILWGMIIPNYSALEKVIPNHNTFWEIKISYHNTIYL